MILLIAWWALLGLELGTSQLPVTNALDDGFNCVDSLNIKPREKFAFRLYTLFWMGQAVVCDTGGFNTEVNPIEIPYKPRGNLTIRIFKPS